MRLHWCAGSPKPPKLIAAVHEQGPSRTAILKVAMSRAHHHHTTPARPHSAKPNQLHLPLPSPIVNPFFLHQSHSSPLTKTKWLPAQTFSSPLDRVMKKNTQFH
uniref:(northern house mosquito) hypothetical protein n=1 Tax=Culex pipiens TaxID=7175 RepID=A0A8D8ET82_CULPI